MRRDQVGEAFGKIGLLQMVRRYIDAHWQVQCLVRPAFHLLQCGADDPFHSDTQACPSMSGKKAPGASKPRSGGCCQRIKASAPTTAPVRRLTLGW